jgi:uncharacterized membrane protein YfhO
MDRYTSDEVTLQVESTCAGLLVLPDTYFPGWTATVNGHERPIYPTDGAFRGVTVPKGTSRVEFRYEPRQFQAGIVLAAGGVVGFLVIWLLCGWRGRNRRRDGGPAHRSEAGLSTDLVDEPASSGASP